MENDLQLRGSYESSPPCTSFKCFFWKYYIIFGRYYVEIWRCVIEIQCVSLKCQGTWYLLCLNTSHWILKWSQVVTLKFENTALKGENMSLKGDALYNADHCISLIYMHLYAWIFIYTNTNAHTHTYTNIHTQAHAHTRTHTYAHIHINFHAYIHIHGNA